MARKAQNSILLLTTLGVYIGLLVAGGAAPQVLAHSATTRNFEISDEIEVKDDLDKKPHPDAGCESFSWDRVTDLEYKYLWFNKKSVGEYLRALDSVFKAYPENKAEWIDLSWTTPDDSRPFRVTDSPSGFFAPIQIDTDTRKEIEGRVWELANGFHAANGFEYSVKRNAVETVATLTLNFSGVEPKTFYSAYVTGFDWAKCASPFDRGYPAPEQVASENTNLFIKNDVLVIITRLPRGSLDPLLAKDAK